MDVSRIDEMLRTTFDDLRLSRGEKHVLEQVFDEFSGNEEAFRHIRNRAFEIAREVVESKDATDAVNWLEGVIRVLDKLRSSKKTATQSGYFSPGDACLQCILQAIAETCFSLDICVYTITDNRIKNAILDAFNRNVAVRIITDDEKVYDPGSDIYDLSRNGIEVAIDGAKERMHHKFALFDGHHLATGSYNWTRSASSVNYENVVLTDDVALVQMFIKEFERLWTNLPRFEE